MNRPSMDTTLIAVATTLAQRSTCSRLNVGAVLARGGRILSTGYNGAPSGVEHCQHDADTRCEISAHAEANAVAFAARHGAAAEGASIYITHAPCPDCSGLLINAGITEVVYALPYRTMVGVEKLRAAGVSVRKLEES